MGGPELAQLWPKMFLNFQPNAHFDYCLGGPNELVTRTSPVKGVALELRAASTNAGLNGLKNRRCNVGE